MRYISDCDLNLISDVSTGEFYQFFQIVYVKTYLAFFIFFRIPVLEQQEI